MQAFYPTKNVCILVYIYIYIYINIYIYIYIHVYEIRLEVLQGLGPHCSLL